VVVPSEQDGVVRLELPEDIGFVRRAFREFGDLQHVSDGISEVVEFVVKRLDILVEKEIERFHRNGSRPAAVRLGLVVPVVEGDILRAVNGAASLRGNTG